MVETVLVENQGIAEPTDLQEPIPVATVAGQAGDFQPDHQSGVSYAYLGHEFLETLAICRRAAGLSLVAVDDDDAIRMPAECEGALPESVLESCRSSLTRAR